jgi:hypothetical protein
MIDEGRMTNENPAGSAGFNSSFINSSFFIYFADCSLTIENRPAPLVFIRHSPFIIPYSINSDNDCNPASNGPAPGALIRQSSFFIRHLLRRHLLLGYKPLLALL